MDIREGMSVVTPEEESLGKVERVVLNPQTCQVTGLVVRKGFLLREDKVIPIEAIEAADNEQLQLKPGTQDPDSFPPFIETEYVELDEAERTRAAYDNSAIPPLYWYPSWNIDPVWSGTGYFGAEASDYKAVYWSEEKEENIPSDTVALSRGAAVISAEGKRVGDLVEWRIDLESKQATHLVISRGLLFKKERVIPVSWIDKIDTDGVYLAVGADFIQRLPAREG